MRITPLTVDQVKQIMADTEDLIILDTRDANNFADGFLPGSIFIEMNDRFEDWVISLLPAHYPCLLVTEPGKEQVTADRLRNAGIEQIKGYLDGGFEKWKDEGQSPDMIIQVEADELAMDIPFDENLLVLDIRNETAFADGHVKDSLNMPLKTMVDAGVMAILDEKANLYVLGNSGSQSLMASSLLKRQGFHNLHNMQDGWELVQEQKGIPIEKEKSALN